jgi:hypothetical protein
LEEETGGPDKSLHTIYIVTLDWFNLEIRNKNIDL